MRITQEYLRNRYILYTTEKLESYVFKGRKWVSINTVLKDKDIKTDDKLWLILDPDFIEEKKLHLLACVYAEHIPRTEEALALIQSKRDWIAGKTTDNELEKRRAADWSAYWVAVWAAAGVADWDAEREWQLEQAIKVMEED